MDNSCIRDFSAAENSKNVLIASAAESEPINGNSVGRGVWVADFEFTSVSNTFAISEFSLTFGGESQVSMYADKAEATSLYEETVSLLEFDKSQFSSTAPSPLISENATLLPPS